MHPLEPMAGHILPVIFSWHLGIELNPVAGKWTGALHPLQRRFRIPPLAPGDAATDDRPPGFKPIERPS